MKRNLRLSIGSVLMITTAIVLIANIAVAQTNTGIGTITPTERLDVAVGNVRIRDINSITGLITDRMLVADGTGIVKSLPMIPTIYTANGTLTGNRTVTQLAYTLNFTGTASSMVKLTNTAGTATTPVPALQIMDGSQGAGKVLTSDAFGNTSWTFSALKAIPGVLPTDAASKSFTAYNGNLANSTGATIDLPPGKWMVAFGTTASIGGSDIITSDGSLWCTLFLADNLAAATAGTATADLIAAYSSTPNSRGAAGNIGRGMNKTFVSGYQAVWNQTSATKTYYVGASLQRDGTTTSASGNAYWVKVMSPLNWERYFYAIPIQ